MKRKLIILMCVVFTGVCSCGNDSPVITPDPDENPDPGSDPGSDPDPEQDVFMKYYVAMNGNDSADGSLETPFATINHALSKVNPGDTVLVRQGSYHEFVMPLKSGQAGKVITLMSFPGETAKIDGTGLYIKGWHKALVVLSGIRYMTLEGLHICNAVNSEPQSDPEGIYINGSARAITIKDCKVYEIRNTTLKLDSSDWRSAHAILVVGTDDSSPIRDLVIEGCEIYDCYTGTSESLTLAGNIDGFTVCNNIVRDVENIGIIVAGGEGLNPGGNMAVNYARNGVVRDNLVYNNTHTKSPEFWGPTRYGAIGIYVCGGTTTTVERNIVYGCDRGIGLVSESNIHATRECIVRNNFVYNCYRTGIYMGDYLNYTTGGTSGCYVVNNTVFNNNSVTGALGEKDGEGEIRITANCTNNVIKNNIVYARPNNDVFIRKYTTSGSNNVVDYNHYYSTGTPKWIWDDVEYTGFEAWKAACKGDANSVYGTDPMLVGVDPQNPDLHIRPESPARNTGQILSAYINGYYDIDGNPRIVDGRISKGAQQ